MGEVLHRLPAISEVLATVVSKTRAERLVANVGVKGLSWKRVSPR